MKKIKLLALLFFSLAFLFMIYTPIPEASAAGVAEVEVSICPDGSTGACTRSWAGYIENLFGFLLKIGSVLVVLMLVYAGYILMTSQGDSSKITTAKEIALGSILGLIILILIPLFIRFLGLPDM